MFPFPFLFPFSYFFFFVFRFLFLFLSSGREIPAMVVAELGTMMCDTWHLLLFEEGICR